MSEGTLVRVCPVSPIQLGVSLVRYDRREIDAWLDTLPPRLLQLVNTREEAGSATGEEDPPIQESRTQTAVERARLRASKASRRRLN